mgnify:CR=1 FL=1
MNGDKEFQIMITVPSAKTDSNRIVQEAEKKEVIRDLEQDVTDMIHEIRQSYSVRNQRYKFGVGGLSFPGVNGITEQCVQCLHPSPAPCHLNGMANRPLHEMILLYNKMQGKWRNHF